MKALQIIGWLLGSWLLIFTLASCSSNDESDDSEAEAAFNASDTVIDSGELDGLKYEVRTDAVRFTNDTTHAATFTQYNAENQVVDVNTIRKQTLEEVFTHLGSAVDGKATHRFIHADAVTGEIFFKGEHSMMADAINILRTSLETTESAGEVAICFFLNNKSNDPQQMENTAKSCLESFELFNTVNILEDIGNLVVDAFTTAQSRKIKLKAAP